MKSHRPRFLCFKKGITFMPLMMQERTLAREKKVGKLFQYDMPSDLLMTFLAEVSS